VTAAQPFPFHRSVNGAFFAVPTAKQLAVVAHDTPFNVAPAGLGAPAIDHPARFHRSTSTLIVAPDP